MKVRPDGSGSVPYASDELAWATVEALQLLLGERRPPERAVGAESEVPRLEYLDGRARRRLAESNLSTVVATARRYRHSGVPLLDLIQQGILGLLRAIATFDPQAGVPLASCVQRSVEEALECLVTDRVRTVGIPLHVAECVRKLGRAEQTLTRRLGRPPREAELAEAAGLSAAQLRVTRQAVWAVADDAEGPAQVELQLDLGAEALQQAVAALPEFERRALVLRYGIGGREPCSLTEASRMLGLPRGEVVALEEEALERLALEREIQALRSAA